MSPKKIKTHTQKENEVKVKPFPKYNALIFTWTLILEGSYWRGYQSWELQISSFSAQIPISSLSLKLLIQIVFLCPFQTNLVLA